MAVQQAGRTMGFSPPDGLAVDRGNQHAEHAPWGWRPYRCGKLVEFSAPGGVRKCSSGYSARHRSVFPPALEVRAWVPLHRVQAGTGAGPPEGDPRGHLTAPVPWEPRRPEHGSGTIA